MVTDGEGPSCATAETAHKTPASNIATIHRRKRSLTKAHRRGTATIAQRFSAGKTKNTQRVPEGRLKLSLILSEGLVPTSQIPTSPALHKF